MQYTTIGEIPNPLALAHWIATSSTAQQEHAVYIFPSPTEKRQCAIALHAFGFTAFSEWNGDRFSISYALSQNTVLLLDEETLDIHRLPKPETFKKNIHTLYCDQNISIETLKEILTHSEYERDTVAHLPGTFSIRGNVVDIFLDVPIRIECGENSIEQIWSFDIASGEIQEKKERITLPPLGILGDTIFLEYLSTTNTLYFFHIPPKKDHTHNTIFIDALSTPSGNNAGYTLSPAYHLRYKKIEQDIRTASMVHIFTEHTERIQHFLPQAILHENIGLLDGIIHKNTGTYILTDKAIGHTEEKQKKRSNRVNEAMILNLTPGDYVVHLFHGIARFAGMETMHINDRDRDYFVLEYAQKDKIYVPVEMAERIDKYMGGENPSLHRLSTASWSEAVASVKKEAQEMAAELLALYARREKAQAPVMHLSSPEDEQKEASLNNACEFDLTADQEKALHDVLTDMEQPVPMDRLLCGDVGFGKTEVALRAAYRAVLCGYQVALLAPTTVLAQQHYDTFSKRLQEYDIRIGILSRLHSIANHKKTLADMQHGDVDIVIGTHRLLSKDIQFKRLGLIIIDEEQRFGVKAKETLKKLRANTHILTMTATPIPRTLHLSLSGVRKISTILTPPQTRKAVKTVITQLNDTIIKDAITHEMNRGGQTYYIYNRVETIDIRKEQLQTLLPAARIGVAHGQLPTALLTSVMHAFDVGEIDVLLSSTIVENGLDIPQANTLIVEDASRFGLAQLYQLKGRVGRSDQQGHAYFLYKERIPDGDAQKRFVALEQAQALGAGFELAMKDMEIRGIGNILGKEQHGHAVKIGLHLYIRLLNQAMQELEGEEVIPERDIPIDLPLEARIPEEIVTEQADRILLYQQLANIHDIDALKEKKTSYMSKNAFLVHGDLHPSVAGLFDLLEIKLLSARSTLTSIETMHPDDFNRLDSPRITMTTDEELPPLPSAWEIVNHGNMADKRARVLLSDLGEEWVEKFKNVIRLLQKQHEKSIPNHQSTHREQ